MAGKVTSVLDLAAPNALQIHEHQLDAMTYAAAIKMQVVEQARDRLSRPIPATPQIIQHHHTAADCSTPGMVMELLKRGFAVIKMPEDGSLPEALK